MYVRHLYQPLPQCLLSEVGSNTSVLAGSATKETGWMGGKLVWYGMCNLSHDLGGTMTFL